MLIINYKLYKEDMKMILHLIINKLLNNKIKLEIFKNN